MDKNRLEAFSDGVLAIIITIMVLEIKTPHDTRWSALVELLPVFASYLISFMLVGIYWGNHHHLLHGVKKINSAILLSNLLLLFWLSLVPFATAWMGENDFAPNTLVLYGVILMICGVSYTILQQCILKTLDPESEIVKAIRKQDKKALISMLADAAAIGFAFWYPSISLALFFFQSAIWLIPDRNIERALSAHPTHKKTD